MTPTITDDDNGTITATVDGKVVRSWQYGLVGNGVNGRTYRMALAREYAEGWHDCAKDWVKKCRNCGTEKLFRVRRSAKRAARTAAREALIKELTA